MIDGVGVLGVPYNSAGRTDGVAVAPAALRRAGLLEALAETSSVRDYGDVTLTAPSTTRDPETHVIDPDGLRAVVGRVRDGVSRILDDGRFPLVLGGDCPVLLGCLAAFGRTGGRRLLFVDGHEDAYPPELSTTGEAADMELGLALGLVEPAWWPELAALSPLVGPDDVHLLGPRDRRAIESYGSRSLAGRVAIDDGATLAGDPRTVTAGAVRSLRPPWWLHVDLDVLSTDALPAVDYPQDGGLDWTGLDIVTRTALAAAPVGWDVTIYNPDLDPEATYAQRIVGFIASSIGDAA